MRNESDEAKAGWKGNLAVCFMFLVFTGGFACLMLQGCDVSESDEPIIDEESLASSEQELLTFCNPMLQCCSTGYSPLTGSDTCRLALYYAGCGIPRSLATGVVWMEPSSRKVSPADQPDYWWESVYCPLTVSIPSACIPAPYSAFVNCATNCPTSKTCFWRCWLDNCTPARSGYKVLYFDPTCRTCGIR